MRIKPQSLPRDTGFYAEISLLCDQYAGAPARGKKATLLKKDVFGKIQGIDSAEHQLPVYQFRQFRFDGLFAERM